MKKRVLCLLLTLVMVLALLPIGASAVNYYTVPINSYDAFRSATIGKGYDIDGYYGYQCWDGAALLWQQLGMSLQTGNGGARGCWELKKEVNAGDQFTLIYSLSDVKRGDVVVLGVDSLGHICFADEDYSGSGWLKIYGQNQANSGPFSVINHGTSTFLGAFRYKGWSCKHTYSNYVCTKCGAWNESSVKTSSVNLTFAATGSGIVRSGPYSGCSRIKTLSEGTIINATQKVTNAEGNVWYKLSDGGYIYSGNVKAVSVPPVSFTDVAVSNNHYIYSVTEYNALLVVTIKPNISGIVCTKEGIELYDSSGTISSSHLLKKFNFTDRLGFNPAIYVSFDMNAEVGYTLSPGTKYYYRFYAEIDNGSSCSIYYSDTYSCTTAQVSHTHSYGSAWKSDGSNHWHECSCGAKSGTAAHSYGSWITTSAATHTTAGSKYRTCSVCGYKQTQSISATGHSYDKQNTNAKYLKSAATCTEPAVYYYSCSCGEKGSKTFTYGDALGHKFKNGTCTTCGVADPDYNSGGNSGIAGLFTGFFDMIRNLFSRIFSIFTH